MFEGFKKVKISKHLVRTLSTDTMNNQKRKRCMYTCNRDPVTGYISGKLPLSL